MPAKGCYTSCFLSALAVILEVSLQKEPGHGTPAPCFESAGASAAQEAGEWALPCPVGGCFCLDMSFSLGSGLFPFFHVILFPHKALSVLLPRCPCEGDSLWSSSGRTVPCGQVSCFQPEAAPPQGKTGGGWSQEAPLPQSTQGP